MPLAQKYRDLFNETAAQEEFYRLEGLPYGYHNFIYGWVDTPNDNFPRMITPDLVPVVFSILEKFDKNVTENMFSLALNKHLGSEGLNISGIVAKAASKGMNITEAMAVVEEDGWEYEFFYHDGEAYVCSAFVIKIWMAAGVFGDTKLNAVEWGPNDVYMVDIFDHDYAKTKPSQCKEDDPTSPWCQLLGKYRMTFPKYSSIPMYDHMNEHCPTVAPEFYRPDGC